MKSEIEMFEKLMIQFHKAFHYLDGNDDVTLKVTLNLNPELTDWQNSELRQGYFVSRFGILFNGIKNINEVILDTSCWGTTQQKRESYKMDYGQFIFCDTDILFHEHMLKYQLNASYQLDDIYIISPSLAKFWDTSWDVLCHSDYMDKHIGYSTEREAIENTKVQEIKEKVEEPIVVCPHCKESILIEKLNCGIFRHGVSKVTGQQLTPHLDKQNCDSLKDRDLIAKDKESEMNNKIYELELINRDLHIKLLQNK